MANTYYKLHIFGVVQGVGFRPFVDVIAAREGVFGSVCNKGPYVEVFVGGTAEQVAAFEKALVTEAPERSSILKVEKTPLTEADFDAPTNEFHIIKSEKVKGDIFVSPDIATCPKCKKELYDPSDRRYLHPFINCTACGPRLTILDSMPYDRVRTSMAEFPMCPDCEGEYTSPKTRRYHAQPVCCNDCGPELYLCHDRTADGPLLKGNDALFKTRAVIRAGGIVAIKGIGGFHLCCDATNEEAVTRLRKLKNRPFKPFAVMLKDMDVVHRECAVLEGQEELLTGPQKPILLLEKHAAKLCPSIAPENPNVGVMLPYNPVQYLLFHHPEDPAEQRGEPFPDCLVMTSGNPRGAPICRTDEEALEVLAPMCDLILSHNRKIRLRADDSVVSWQDGKPYMIRRSRGYAPLPFWVDTPESTGMTVLGIGGELKNTFCIAKGNLFYPSPFIGDMADLRSVEALKEAVHRMGDLLEVTPDLIVCDAHPLYHSSEVARELGEEFGVPVVEVQHHYAHTLSCMAENNYLEPVIGVSFDGTGYGSDGTIWGGEFLLADAHGFERAGSIAPFPQAGGDASSREGWRIAVSLLKQVRDQEKWESVADLENWSFEESEPPLLEAPSFEVLVKELGLCNEMQLGFLEAQLEGNINCVESTSVGRVFDAASAILGFRRENTCEGEASMILEFAAERWAKNRLAEWATKGEDVSGIRLSDLHGGLVSYDRQPDAEGPFQIDLANELYELAVKKFHGEDPDKLAYEFHGYLADVILSGCCMCREDTGRNVVALSGGCFQNLLLTEMTVRGLEENEFKVLTHSLSAPNDGGIALGQALYGMNINRQIFSSEAKSGVSK